MITITTLFSAATASATNKNGNTIVCDKQYTHIVTDTPYSVTARIARSGVRDTPYLFIAATPATIYAEVEQALASEKGMFSVELWFYAETGMPVRTEKYYIRMGQGLNISGAK